MPATPRHASTPSQGPDRGCAAAHSVADILGSAAGAVDIGVLQLCSRVASLLVRDDAPVVANDGNNRCAANALTMTPMSIGYVGLGSNFVANSILVKLEFHHQLLHLDALLARVHLLCLTDAACCQARCA